MSRAVVIPDATHYPKSGAIASPGAFRMEARFRGITPAGAGISILHSNSFNFQMYGSVSGFEFYSFKAGDTVYPLSLSFPDPVFRFTLPRRYEHKLRFQFDPVALTYTLEVWDLLNGDRLISQAVNGVGGMVVAPGDMDLGAMTVGNNGSGGSGSAMICDYLRVYNTIVAPGSAAPDDAAPAAAAVFAAWEYEDSLADTKGLSPMTWQGGGAAGYTDQEAKPSIAPVLSSAVYNVAPDRVDLVFTAPNVGGETAPWVDVERRIGTTGDWKRVGFTTNAGATTFADGPAKHAVTYNYRVKARNRLGSSAYSNIVAVTTGAGVDTNPTITENAKAGTPAWQITTATAALAREIEGYCDATSYKKGDTVNMKVHSVAAENFNCEVFRMGWYGGDGARRIRNVLNIAGTVQVMPVEGASPRYDRECNWTTSYALPLVDGDATEWPSGIYLCRLTQVVSGKQVFLIFTIRDEARRSEFAFNSPVMTWNSYNYWPNVAQGATSTAGSGRSTYTNQAVTVSLNRPWMVPRSANNNHTIGSGSFIGHLALDDGRVNQVSDEYNQLRWLEKNGYDVQYITDYDLHTMQEKVWSRCAGLLFPSHTEYVTLQMRDTVVAARNYGRHLAFIGANQFYWQVRLEPGPVTGQADRTMVCYKNDPTDPANIGPIPYPEFVRLYTIRWQDLGAFPYKPERFLGVGYQAGDFGNDPYVVTPAGAAHALNAGTGLVSGEAIAGLVGYEFDMSNGLCDYPVTILSHTSPSGTGVGDADSVVYSHPNGALVYAAGTLQLGWALDDFNAPAHRVSRLNAKIQTLLTNILAVQRQFTIAEVGSGGGGGVVTLVWTRQPGASASDGLLAPQPRVERRVDGATVPGDATVITMALATISGGPGQVKRGVGGALGASVSGPAVDGVFDPGDVIVHAVATGTFKLDAS